MAVSIWEGNKAQALIDAVARTQKIDKQQGSENAGKVLTVGSDGLVVPSDSILSSGVVDALLTCFRHVAWADANGQDFYDALEAAISGVPVPEYDHTVMYNASNGVILSETDGFEVVDGDLGGLTQTISNGILNVQLGSSATHYVMMRLEDYTSEPASAATKARFVCKYRANVVSPDSTDGVTLTLKAGTSCVGLYMHSLPSDNKTYFAVRDSSNQVVDTTKELVLGQWYEVEGLIENNTQIIKVDGEQLYSGTGNTNFGSSGFVFTRHKYSGGLLNADIEWAKFQWS